MENHTKTTVLLLILITLGLMLTGCSKSSDNPVVPDIPDGGGQEETLTPKYLKINKVTVDSFGEKNGGNWDFSTSVSKRRPDIYVQLRAGTSVNEPFYVSNVVEDAFSGVFTAFTESEDGGVGLPRNHSAGSTLYVELMDDDGLSADDLMGSVQFDPLDYYRNDNALGFDKTFSGSNSAKLRVSGTWVY